MSLLDTFADTAPEVHALGNGLYNGFIDFMDWNGIDPEIMENPDVRAEPHYARGGYVAGAVLRWIVALTLLENFV
ncbi:hypothetical protein AKJ64_03415 [candidate division MSBL1 archaeon SCGC-AAA259E17]|uniref:Uncharacterized protein n=1 Tax=candidate division MSBL1 archaeon SCGC-AAA259E17 TaxID=1698263 RepID=A0A133UDQ4_9EURY|nr:hypothetical protein AKJ64_03415 [candidate division MSBL1 archaeon SCGC-AAA259E17]